MALLTAAEFVARIDARRIRDSVLDNDTRATEADIVDPLTTAGSRVQVAIADAEGEFYSAVTVGGRYLIADIDAMVNNIDAAIRLCGSANLIRNILANLAYGNLLKRRALPLDDFSKSAPGYYDAQEKLTLLRQAERIFPDIAGVVEAGLPDSATSVPEIDTAAPLMSQIAFNYFGNINQPQYGTGTNPYWWGRR